MSSELYDTAIAATKADAVRDLKDISKKDEQVAREFLAKTCPQFLAALDTNAPNTADRLVKAGRNIQATLQYAVTSTDENADDKTRMEKAVGALTLLVEECSTMTNILTGQETRRVPKVRFGKTELQMPLVTLGCMRFQQSWNRGGADSVSKIDQVEQECQDNLVAILKHGIAMGVNHIETAKGYGCSELQLGDALQRLFKEKFVKREDLIIQTKGGVAATMTPANYKKQVNTQLQTLKVKYVDIYSVHGLNSELDFKYLFDNDPEKGNLITALQELQAEGKIRHIGFSTHGRADLIRRAIETDAFACLNLHHHFIGSYTASGDSSGTMTGDHHGNWANVELARSKDMGVFIISPYDKGGRLYTPSVKLRELTLPEFEPMTFGSLWLWQYHLYQDTPSASKGPMAHTMTIGAARPSDLDQPILASFKLIQDGTQDTTGLLVKTNRVSERLQKRMESIPGGAKWAETWHVGLPNWYNAKLGTQHGNIVWLYNLIHGYGLLEFAKERYATMYPRIAQWDESKSHDENVAAIGAGFNWMPGSGISADHDYTEDFANCPEGNKQQLKEAIAFVHKWCQPAKKDGEEGGVEKLEVPYEWQIAYDMRAWTAYPERG